MKIARVAILSLILLGITLTFTSSRTEVQAPKTRILFLLDASGSMYARMDENTRMTVAKRLLSHMVDSLKKIPNLEIALRVYGHQSPRSRQDCRDTKLEVPFAPNNHFDMKAKLKEIEPKGTTLISYSLQEAAYDFPKEDGVRNVIILITDGIEECSGDPCAVSEALQKQQVILKPFIIGIGATSEFPKQFDCVGRYFEANSEESFENVLGVVISQALNETTAQVNLLDQKGQPTETDVNFTLYDQVSGRVMYSYVHTMNGKGYPDTLSIDPAYKYELVVHTTPEVRRRDIELRAGKHNIIGVDAPQGSLYLKVDGRTKYDNLMCIVTHKGKSEIVNVQTFFTEKKYIIGTYDLEILSLPRIKVTAKIEQDKKTQVQIPEPGWFQLQSATGLKGSVFMVQGGKYIWVCDLLDNTTNQMWMIQPGSYKIIARLNGATNTAFTAERDFTVKSGSIQQVNIR